MSGRARRVLAGAGELLVTVGVVLLLFCAYELWVTGLYTDREQRALGDRLDRAWAQPLDPAAPSAAPPSAAPPSGAPPSGAPAGASSTSVSTRRPPTAPYPAGSGFARLWVPRFGAGYSRVVVEGVSVADLKKGPGHYPGTALPGQVGNVVLSGHRTTYGEPFHRIAELRRGDAVVLETRTDWFTYRVTGFEVVPPTRVSVTLPVPDRPGVRPTEALLTMTSCHPEYSARERWVTRAVLQSRLPKAGGARPPALGG